jgi:hypothetical protein
MKFGKRDEREPAGAAGAAVGDTSALPPLPDPPAATEVPLPPVPDRPPPVSEHEIPPVPVAEAQTPGSPAGEELPIAHVEPEPVVEGEAYEVFAEEPPPDTLNVHRHEPGPAAAPMPVPVAEQPVSVVTAGPGPPPVSSLADAGEAFASGHAAAPGPSWQEPIMQVANERPELVVAAAFAGGLLAAMILRRLGR